MDFRLLGAIAQLAGYQHTITCERRGKRLRYIRIATPRTVGVLPLPMFAAHVRRYYARHPLTAEAASGFPSFLAGPEEPAVSTACSGITESRLPGQADPADPWGVIEADIAAEHDEHEEI